VCERNSARHIVFFERWARQFVLPVIRTVCLLFVPFGCYLCRLPVTRTVYLLFVPFPCYSYRLAVICAVHLSLVPSTCYSYRLPVIRTVWLLFVPFTCHSYRLPVIRTVFLLLVPFGCYLCRVPVTRTVYLLFVPFACYSYRLAVICAAYLSPVPAACYSYRLPVRYLQIRRKGRYPAGILQVSGASYKAPFYDGIRSMHRTPLITFSTRRNARPFLVLCLRVSRQKQLKHKADGSPLFGTVSTDFTPKILQKQGGMLAPLQALL